MGDYATKEEGLNLGNAVATAILVTVFLAIVAFKIMDASMPRSAERISSTIHLRNRSDR